MAHHRGHPWVDKADGHRLAVIDFREARLPQFIVKAVSWLQRAISRALYRALAFIARMAFQFLPPRPATALMRFISVGALIRMTDPIWRRMLQSNHYRFMAVEWIEHVDRRTKGAGSATRLVQALIETKQFARARAALAVAKQRVYARRRLEGLFETLVNLETILELEERGLGDCLHSAVIGRSFIGDYFYRRAWEAHTMRNAKRVLQCVNIYFLAHRYDPEIVIYACQSLLRPNELWEAIVEAVDKARAVLDQAPLENPNFAARRARRATEHELTALRLMSLVQGSKFDAAAAMIDADAPAELLPAIASFHAARGALDEAMSAGEQALFLLRNMRKAETREKLADMVCALGLMMEEARAFEDARTLYRRAFEINGIRFYIPEPVYRYFSLLLANGEWHEALLILRRAHLLLWRSFSRLARRPITDRLDRREYVPKSGALILGGWGIGDEIIRLAVLRECAAPGAPYGYLCDPRLLGMFSRSLPQFEFLSNSRTFGPFAVSEEEYWRDREGAPVESDLARISEKVLTKLRDYPDLALSEDLFFHLIAQEGRFRARREPMLQVRPESAAAVRQWMGTLPRGVNVGVTWRSGTRDVTRDKSYTAIADWGEILTIPGVNFISLQYSDVTEELREVEAKFGVKIHQTPGVDLKDDLEEVAALCAACDVVLAPGTAVRELSGAVGATTWSLSTTPFFPDLWRIASDSAGADADVDVVFPSIQHFTAMRYGSRAGVLSAVARELAKWPKRQASAA